MAVLIPQQYRSICSSSCLPTRGTTVWNSGLMRATRKQVSQAHRLKRATYVMPFAKLRWYLNWAISMLSDTFQHWSLWYLRENHRCQFIKKSSETQAANHCRDLLQQNKGRGHTAIEQQLNSSLERKVTYLGLHFFKVLCLYVHSHSKHVYTQILQTE